MSTSKQEELSRLLLEVENAAGKLIEVLSELRRLNRQDKEDYAAFLDTLLLGVREYNILNGRFDFSTRTRNDVLKMTANELFRLKNCGAKSMGRIRAALEAAGYEHQLAKGWDAPNSKSDREYRRWLPILQLAKQQDIPVRAAERWMMHPEKYNAPI